jgi:SAM-dependent methyltransferase
MTQPYSSPIMRQALGDALRPGGLQSTLQLLELAPLPANSLVLDAGCGPGKTAALLLSHKGSRIIALDRDSTLLAQAGQAAAAIAAVQGDVAALPIASESLDAVFCECVLALLHKPEMALAEFHRTLKPGGRLYYSDMTAQGGSGCPDTSPKASCLDGPEDLESLRQRLLDLGFSVMAEKDQTRLLRETAGRLIFEFGSLDLFWQAVLGQSGCRNGCSTNRPGFRPGYVAFLCRKETSYV